MRIRHLFPVLWLGLAIGCTTADDPAAADPSPPPLEPVAPSWNFEEARQFDFWIGEWDVNLRMLQEDLTWQDSVAARAHVWRILDGKAILELWDSEPIKGFSLRYFDRDAGKWKLWLSWPGRNRSGGSGLEGAFRHGRGEFFSTVTGQDGSERINRYSFSDISANSLRWDDAYSTDGGKTWSANWIMEFTRTAAAPPWPPAGETLHTWHDGSRCDREEFRLFEQLAGRWTGTAVVAVDGAEHPAALTAYKTLDGCAVIAFVRYGSVEELRLLTFNTHAGVYEENRLDNRPGTGLDVRYGAVVDGAVILAPRSEAEGGEVRWEPGPASTTLDESGEGAAYRAVFSRS